MLRPTAAALAACLIFQSFGPAACAHAQAAGSFRVIPVEMPPHRNHLWAYASMLGGAGLIAASFRFAEQGNDAYAAYLTSTDPGEIERLYDRSVHYDRISQASLLTGEVFLAAGVYLRFIRRPGGSRIEVSALPSRCAVSFRF